MTQSWARCAVVTPTQLSAATTMVRRCRPVRTPVQIAEPSLRLRARSIGQVRARTAVALLLKVLIDEEFDDCTERSDPKQFGIRHVNRGHDACLLCLTHRICVTAVDQSAASGEISGSAASSRSLAEGIISGLGGCRIAPHAIGFQVQKASPRWRQVDSSYCAVSL
jgi:hypothetical protein